MFKRRGPALLETLRIDMRLPVMRDYEDWSALRKSNEAFLSPWEPKRHDDYNTPSSFKERVRWSKESFKSKRAVALIIRKKSDNTLMGAITLDNIIMGPAQRGSVGYWLGEEFTGQGYMSEALSKIVTYAFTELDLSRIEAATLKNNKASRKLLENSGFRYEGVAQSYLQIAGRWKPHVLYANLRRDRIGATESGVF